MKKTLINFYYEGEVDSTLIYNAPQSEVYTELKRIKKYISDNWMNDDYDEVSDLEVYERELDKKFTQVDDYNTIDFDY